LIKDCQNGEIVPGKGFVDQIKDMRGYLYRKIIKKKAKNLTKTRMSRAAYLSAILKEKQSEQLFLKRKKIVKHVKSKYPKFYIRTPTRPILFSNKITKSMRYPLMEPYVYARIVKNPIKEEFNYYIIEPELTEKEIKALTKIKEGLIQTIDVKLSTVRKQDKLLSYLEKNVQKLIDEYGFELNANEYLRIMYYIYRDFVGLNEIEPLFHDPYVEDIGCDGIHVPVYVVHKRFGSVKTTIKFDNPEYLKQLVIKMAERCDRYISYANPLLDGTLPDGTRVQASLAGDVTTKGPTFSLRKFTAEPFTPVDMIKLGTASSELLSYLWFLVENGVNILICGGVATGKTTLLNCIALFMPPELKIISIEDTRELNLPHENWIPGVTRVGFGTEAVGQVTIFDLLKESFRQNPDYLIVGEVRGKEASAMFQGMASGHPSISTMHAGSLDAVVKRLETPPINLPPGLLESLDMIIIMVHARELRKDARRIKEVLEIESVIKDTGAVKSIKSFAWLPAVDKYEYRGNSYLLQKLSAEKGISLDFIKKELKRRQLVLEWMLSKNITDWKEVSEYISMYEKNPKKIMNMIKKNEKV